MELRLVADLGEHGARQAISVLCAKFSPLERAALAAHWPTWARPKQLPPIGEWRSWGFLCGRGYGKTRSVAEHINAEVEARRIGSLGLAAQNEDKSIEIHIEGPTGLIRTAPPWFRPEWEASKKELVWPNGARAYVRTPIPTSLQAFDGIEEMAAALKTGVDFTSLLRGGHGGGRI